jgi:hypothetical protein
MDNTAEDIRLDGDDHGKGSDDFSQHANPSESSTIDDYDELYDSNGAENGCSRGERELVASDAELDSADEFQGFHFSFFICLFSFFFFQETVAVVMVRVQGATNRTVLMSPTGWVLKIFKVFFFFFGVKKEFFQTLK